MPWHLFTSAFLFACIAYRTDIYCFYFVPLICVLPYYSVNKDSYKTCRLFRFTEVLITRLCSP